MKKRLAVLFFLPFINANAQDTANHKTAWHMIYSIGFNYNQVGGSMPDFIEKFSREFGTLMPQQKDGGGIQLGVFVQKDISEWLYLKSGFGLFETGILLNFAISDKSYKAPDRFETGTS